MNGLGMKQGNAPIYPGMASRQEKTTALVPPAGADPEAHLAGLGIEILHLAIPDTSGTLRQKRFRLPASACPRPPG
jgi:hypothetical protein